MLRRLCLGEIIQWLARRADRIPCEDIRREFNLDQAELDTLLFYLRRRGMIKSLACVGSEETVVSFFMSPNAEEIAEGFRNCPGYGAPPEGQQPPRERVFIVHGRNSEALDAMTRFLKGLRLHPVTFNDAIKLLAKPNPYIGEIVAAGMADAYATLVLLTGDDDVRLKGSYIRGTDGASEMELQSQPRPNVILELGMALGRAPDRTILVRYGGCLRDISDIAGMYLIPFTDEAKDRRNLKDKLESMGCRVNPRGNAWMKADPVSTSGKQGERPRASTRRGPAKPRRAPGDVPTARGK